MRIITLLHVAAIATAKLTKTYPKYKGSCPNIKFAGSQNFDLDAYIKGPWFNVAVSPFFWNVKTAKCITANYKKKDPELLQDASLEDASWIDVINSSIIKFGIRYTARGQAIPSETKPGTLSVSFYQGGFVYKYTYTLQNTRTCACTSVAYVTAYPET